MITRTLTEAVRMTTGLDDAEPRPGQLALAQDIQEAIGSTGQVIGVASTGVGKSFALIVPAMVNAATEGLRSVISTESLSLQAQIMDKDAPLVAKAVKKTTGKDVRFAVLKGFANYVCLTRAEATAEEVLGTGGRTNWRQLVAGLKRHSRTGTITVEGFDHQAAELLPLLEWALSQRGEEPGDKHSYPGPVNDHLWSLVSISSSECAGDVCPLAEYCRPRAAREQAADADVVITNHSMLAVQAANDTPVVIGNATLGNFDIIMVDEAHALPGNVRSQGQAEISARRILSANKSFGYAIDNADKEALRLHQAGAMLANMVEADLVPFTGRLRGEEVARLKEGQDPLPGSGDQIIAWSRECGRKLKAIAAEPGQRQALRARKAAARFEALANDAKRVREHRTGNARWAQRENVLSLRGNAQPASVVVYAPVDVGPLLKRSLWTAPAEADEEDPMVQELKAAGEYEKPEAERLPLAVIAVSATLPDRFGWVAGMDAPNQEYESPFDPVYANSLLYIPKPDAEDLRMLFPGYRPGSKARAKFDVLQHRLWAAKSSAELVEANGGAALVLAATGDNGKAYAAELRKQARGRWKVYSQWDGMTPSQVVNAWRADESSVLVGTKSMMTGVDAKGRTCSLVVIDRIPRSGGNPVDDARVEAIMERMNTDRWSADRFVYVSDASLLLEQAVGRLIRSMTDIGMVAVLDPRLLKKDASPVVYPEPTRAIYKKSLRRFTNVTSRREKALRFLIDRRETHELAA